MANSVKPPEQLEINRGNPSNSWTLWKRNFEIYLRATGCSSEEDDRKIGLLLNHIGDSGIDIFESFRYLATEDDKDYATVIRKYTEYFGKRDPQMMLREQFWMHLKRDPSQTFENWLLTVRKCAQNCKFPNDFAEQAIRDKLTFSCADDAAKAKIYDSGPTTTVDKVVDILFRRETARFELNETKCALVVRVTSHKSKRPPARNAKNVAGSGDKCSY